MTSILKALQNANRNLKLGFPIIYKRQMNDVVTLLKKGYFPDEPIEPLLKKYGKASDVPEKENTIVFNKKKVDNSVK